MNPEAPLNPSIMDGSEAAIQSSPPLVLPTIFSLLQLFLDAITFCNFWQFLVFGTLEIVNQLQFLAPYLIFCTITTD